MKPLELNLRLDILCRYKPIRSYMLQEVTITMNRKVGRS